MSYYNTFNDERWDLIEESVEDLSVDDLLKACLKECPQELDHYLNQLRHALVYERYHRPKGPV